MSPDQQKPLQETVPPPDGEPTAAPPSKLTVSSPDAAPPPEYQPAIEGYHILDRLGAGGMGVVWRAVQSSTRREVALKLVSAAMFGSDRARLRFDREVELMARLEHPNIARVYDSGTDGAVYYYAMELIHGVPLDEFVQQRSLSHRQIIELMRAVCQAVMFAHQRGVIHRDLKPTNIIVTSDGEPHVLDFGLAKGLFDSDSGQAVTIDGEVAGTPAFMSPEQAAGKSVDTRSDVYSLGVILYRLLTGKSPHDLSGSHIKVLQRITDEEIKRPRDASPDIDRELEAVLFRALKKNPEQRYASAGELAQDLDNYLRGEPLLARAPTTIYFLQKRIRKHLFPVSVAALLLLSIMGVAVYAYIRVARERTRALAATEFLSRMLVSADPGTGNRADIRVRDVLDKSSKQIEPGLKNQPEVEAVVRTAIGHTYTVLGLYPAAEEHLRKALALHSRLDGPNAPTTLANQKDLGSVLLYTARYAEAEPLMLDSYQRQLRTLGENHKETADSIFNLALLYMQMKRFDDCLRFGNRALHIRERLFGADSIEVASSLQYIAEAYTNTGRYKEAEALYRRSLAIRQKQLGANHFEVGNSLNNLARLYMTTGDSDQAALLLQQALDVFKTALPPDHPNVAAALENLANIKMRHNELDAAASLAERSFQIKKKMYPPDHPELARSLGLRAVLEGQRGKLALSEDLFHQAIAIADKSVGTDNADMIWLVAGLGLALKDDQKFAEAIPLMRRAQAIYSKIGNDQAGVLELQILDALIHNHQYSEAEPGLLKLYETAHAKNYPDPAARLAELGPVTELMGDLREAQGQVQQAEQFRALQRQLQAATQPSSQPAIMPGSISAAGSATQPATAPH
jgi:serine/threonine protein kinase/Tfp pilus assembly protein PilF